MVYSSMTSCDPGDIFSTIEVSPDYIISIILGWLLIMSYIYSFVFLTIIAGGEKGEDQMQRDLPICRSVHMQEIGRGNG